MRVRVSTGIRATSSISSVSRPSSSSTRVSMWITCLGLGLGLELGLGLGLGLVLRLGLALGLGWDVRVRLLSVRGYHGGGAVHLDVRCARAEDLHKRAWVRLGRDRVRVKLRLTLRLRLEGRVRSRRHEPGPSATTESGSHSSGTTWSAARSWGSSRNAGRLPSCLASDDSSPTSVSWIECWALRLWGGAAAFRGRSVPPSSAHVKRLARSTLTSKRKANAMRYGWSLITTLSRRSSESVALIGCSFRQKTTDTTYHHRSCSLCTSVPQCAPRLKRAAQ